MNGAKRSRQLVLIVGAGPAGCAIAQGLRKKNIPFRIFDKAPSIHHPRYWAFTLGWARPFLLDLLPDSFADRLTECQVDPSIDNVATGNDKIIMYDGKTREASYEFPIPGAKEINIRKLRLLCAEGLTIEYGKKFTKFELGDNGTGVKVLFEDGSSAIGTLVVGVDGATSSVRRQLFGDRASTPDLLPFTLLNFNASYTSDQALYIKSHLHPLVDIAVHPSTNHYIRANILEMPDASDASTWSFQILSTWPVRMVEDYDNVDGSAGRLGRLKELVRRAGWAEPYRSLVEWVPEGTVVGRDSLKIWGSRGWGERGGEGRVALAGDAAHAMTFHRGQGANNAFKDAHAFVQAVYAIEEGEEQRSAMDGYEKAVVERGKKEVQISKTQTFFTHDWENFKNSPVITLGTRPSSES